MSINKINMTKSNSPLDIDEVVVPQKEEKIGANRGSLLELIPLSLIVIGFYMHNNDYEAASQFIIVGWSISAFLYLVFSWYMFSVQSYKRYEVVLSVLSGICFVAGIFGLIFVFESWNGGSELLNFALVIGACLFVISFISFVLNISRSKASEFYRNLLARLLIFCVIIIKMHPDLPF